MTTENCLCWWLTLLFTRTKKGATWIQPKGAILEIEPGRVKVWTEAALRTIA